MANAAAKKAAAAKKEAFNLYVPILIITNLVYIVLLIMGNNNNNNNDDNNDNNNNHTNILQTKLGILGTLMTWVEQIYSYVGILEHASTNATKKSKDLTGGSSLDLLAVTILVQYGSVLHSVNWLWGTVIGVPILAAYSLYKAVYGASSTDKNKSTSGPTKKPKSSEPDENENDPMAAKRQRRAEKRRQKWG